MIYVECKPDFELIKSLGISKRTIIHCGGKARVCKKLQKNTSSIGVVDEDPNSEQPSYILNIKKVNEGGNLKLLYDEKRNNYVVIICPKLEDWILKVSKINNISAKKYGLPNDIDEFEKEINHNLDKFRKLLNALNKTKEFKVLKKFMVKI